MEVIHGHDDGGGGGTGTGYIGVFTNYTDLTTQFPTASALSLAYVANPQGTKWAPGPIFGTYYPRGSYLFDGTNWISALLDVSLELQNLLDEQYKVKVDNADTVGDYLENKIIGNNETFQLKSFGPNKNISFNIRANGKAIIENRDPLASDDISVNDGLTPPAPLHQNGQLWVNQNATPPKLFYAEDIFTVGAANWVEIITADNSPLASLKTKSGIVPIGSFAVVAGNLRASVNFGTAFADANYSISLIETTNANRRVNMKVDAGATLTASGFRISLGTNNPNNIVDVRWIAIKNGEN